MFSRKCLRKERRPSSENRLYVFTFIKMVIVTQLIFNQIFSFENIGFIVTRVVSNLTFFNVEMFDIILVNQNKKQVAALKK